MKYLFLSLLFALPLKAATLNLTKLVASTSGTAGQKNVEVLRGDTVYIDGSVDVGDLLINGRLVCSANAEIKAKTIIVNGTLECGTPAAPFRGKFIISLKHSGKDPRSNFGYRGLIVNANGKLLLAGAPERSGHYRLIRNAEAGQLSVTVNADLSAKWKQGDTVVIASTSYSPEEFDLLKVQSVNKNVITFYEPLKHRHWGSFEKFQTQAGEVTLNQRAEIANLTRNIVIRADESYVPVTETETSEGQLGGHVMVHKGGFATVASVEFSKMGQAGIMARYPFHWHFAGDVPGQYIKDSSIHDSYQRCITVHQTNKALVHNNVCFSFKGHGFFLEDGNEIDNTISSNLGIRARFPSLSKLLLASDHSKPGISGVAAKRFPAVSVFWITHPQNTVINNIAAGSVGSGFWMSFVSVVRKFNPATGEFDGEVLSYPVTSNTLRYENNVAHSTLVGHTWDGAPVQRVYSAGEINPYDLNNPNNPMDRKLFMSHYRPAVTPVFKRVIAYKNLHSGAYFRGNTAIFDGGIFADNGRSLFLAYNQIVKNTLFVGRSKNHSPADDNYLSVKYPLERQSGIVMYDGPWELDRVDFKNFPTAKQVLTTRDGVTYDATAVPMYTIGGSDKLTNIGRKIAFSPEPYHRLYMEPFEGKGGWLEEILSNSVRDKDGTISGMVNGLLLPASPFTSYASCKKISHNGYDSYRGFVLCPPETAISTISFSADNSSSRIPYVTRRSDGAVSLPKSDWDYLDLVGDFSVGGVLHKKMILLTNPSFKYEVLLRPGAVTDPDGLMNLKVKMTSERPNTILPVTRISGLGSSCRLDGAARFNTLAALESATSNGFYSNGNDFYVRLKSEQLFFPIVQGASGEAVDSVSNSYKIVCDAPVINKVTGFIDSVKKQADGTVTINGWACDYGREQVIRAHIYVGGAAGKGGKYIGGVTADRNSEPAVNFACGDATKKGHRFSFVVPPAALSEFKGHSVYVHGISLSGNPNLVLSNSGKFNLP